MFKVRIGKVAYHENEAVRKMTSNEYLVFESIEEAKKEADRLSDLGHRDVHISKTNPLENMDVDGYLKANPA